MEKFNAIIKFKEKQLLDIQRKINAKDTEIKECKESAFKIEQEIKELKNVGFNVYYHGLHSIIDNLKNQWMNIENEIQSKISERNNILSELMIKKQEIKSIEILIEKKKEEFNLMILKKQQDILDELNSIQ